MFAANTHDFLIRLAAAVPRADPRRLRVLTSDGEFHSARRQFARWAEDGWLELETVAAEPFDDFSERFLAAAQRGDHDLILVSQTLFGSGRIFDRVDELAALGAPRGAVGGDRRLSQLHGGRGALVAGRRGERLLPRRRL